MTRSIQAQAEEIFLAANEVPKDQRDDYLRKACSGNAELAEEVESLLAAAQGSESFFSDLSRRLGVAAFLSEPEPETSAPGAAEGMDIGPYRLTRLVGSGGMGTVWQAERSDGRFEGSVAVKLLNLSAGGPVARRFEMEGRYLARLAHPSIARLLDAGVLETGQPYLVLEYVDGVPIDRYCDEQGLDIEQRLRLFLQVLAGVSHAHSSLIVHRDIKPSNILVNADGDVKLLDFGVAKLLDTEADGEPSGLTREFGAALTPTFAAPEQLLGGQITTATDVYSLGLLLYLLLAGLNPRSLLKMESGSALAMLLDTEPPTLAEAVTLPSNADKAPAESAAQRNSTVPALQRKLRGDLDTVVRKALAADAKRRYDTVREFAADIERYLRHQPVTAQPDTATYRLRKFARRHRGGVIASGLTAVTLVAAIVVTTWQMLEARQQRDFALEQQQNAVSINSFSNILFEEIGQTGEAFTLLELLERGVVALDKRRASGRPFLTGTYFDLSQHFSNLGQKQRALDLLKITEQTAASEGDADLEARALCATVAINFNKAPDRARASLARASAIIDERSADLLLTTRVTCARARASVLELDGKRDEARNVLQAAIDYFNDSPLQLNNTKGALIGHLSSLHYKDANFARALELNEQVLRLLVEDGREGGIGHLIVSLNQTGTLQRIGEVSAARERREALLERMKSLDMRGGALTGAYSAHAAGLNRLGAHEQVLDQLPRYREQAEQNGDVRGVAGIDLQLGRAFARRGDYADAHQALDRAADYYARSENINPGALRAARTSQIDLLLREGRLDEARRLLDELLDGMRPAQGAMMAGPVSWTAAKLALAEGQYPEAEEWATRALDIGLDLARAPDTSADAGLAWLTRAEARIALGRNAEAAEDLAAAIAALSNGYGADHEETRRAQTLLGRL